MNHQASRNGNARGDDLACEFGLWGELDNIVYGTRCHHEQDGDRKQMIIDGEAGVRYQDRRPSEVRAAKDGNDHCDQEAEENGESTEARRRLRVDAPLGWVVDGVETYGQALAAGVQTKVTTNAVAATAIYGRNRSMRKVIRPSGRWSDACG